MYEKYGFLRSPEADQFQLFVPDNTIDPLQYDNGGPCRLSEVRIIGDFQTSVNTNSQNWDHQTALPMTKNRNANGYLFTCKLPSRLPDGYYQYKYIATFDNGTIRIVGDPCAKLGGDLDDRSAFVVGGTPVPVLGASRPIGNRLPTKDLRIYELMIDDFTAGYRGTQAPIYAIIEKLDHLVDLNFNAVEFMPWVAWPDDIGFSWGYNPAYFFSVESSYVDDHTDPKERLVRVARLVNECHGRGLHVILDIVLQHAHQGTTSNGFPYYWLWQNPQECPFVGQYVNAYDFGMLPLNYANSCAQQFITDVCFYWMERFNLDGFRFDQVTGFENPSQPAKGAQGLIAALTERITGTKRDNFAMILEDSWGFDAVDDANRIKPTSTWFDIFRSGPFGIFSGYAVKNFVDTSYMRILNAAFQFDAPICPTNYIENHDHGSITYGVGSRERWYKTQPYLIALATCSGAVLVHNGQEWGQFEDIWEDDSHAPAADARVQSRPLLWDEQKDSIGTTIQGIYKMLMGLRDRHPGLRSPNFYPNCYDLQWNTFSPDGYGIDESLQIAIYHRWGNNAAGDLERFIVVLNFGDAAQSVDIPFPANGIWTDLINGDVNVTIGDYWLRRYSVPSNWGCVFFKQ